MLLPAAPLPCCAAATIAETVGTAAKSISETIAEATEKLLCFLIEIKAFSTADTSVLYPPEAIYSLAFLMGAFPGFVSAVRG